MKALVLAAGKSSRIAAKSGGLPKPLIVVAGQPVIAHALRWLARHAVTDCRINLHFRPEVIQETLGDGSRYGVQIRYIHEPVILGTAGAVKNLESDWDESFLVVYGDNLLGFDLDAMLRQHTETGALATVALFHWDQDPHSGIAGGRVVLDSHGQIQGFVEQGTATTLPASPWVNAGVYILQPEICRHIPAGTFYDFGRDVFPHLLQMNLPVWGYPIHDFCLAVDTPEALDRAQEILSRPDAVRPALRRRPGRAT
jgi:NDP-sugar pyrophosphorylase family protein